ncbi:MAG: hypothetical protein IKH78_08145 [Ruminococcus sp.]|nr:hypothetical protein [Ruminococcus sp.]MBR6968489.1 hypothetical protein [Ruminococcus sp.]
MKRLAVKCSCEIEVLFKCDPKKNTACKKRSCGVECTNTLDPSSAALNEDGEPIVSWIHFLEGPVKGHSEVGEIRYTMSDSTGGK